MALKTYMLAQHREKIGTGIGRVTQARECSPLARMAHTASVSDEGVFTPMGGIANFRRLQ